MKCNLSVINWANSKWGEREVRILKLHNYCFNTCQEANCFYSDKSKLEYWFEVLCQKNTDFSLNCINYWDFVTQRKNKTVVLHNCIEREQLICWSEFFFFFSFLLSLSHILSPILIVFLLKRHFRHFLMCVTKMLDTIGMHEKKKSRLSLRLWRRK